MTPTSRGKLTRGPSTIRLRENGELRRTRTFRGGRIWVLSPSLRLSRDPPRPFSPGRGSLGSRTCRVVSGKSQKRFRGRSFCHRASSCYPSLSVTFRHQETQGETGVDTLVVVGGGGGLRRMEQDPRGSPQGTYETLGKRTDSESPARRQWTQRTPV